MYNPNPDPYHRRHSLRLNGYDYSSSGLYFVTICTHDNQHLFGEINDNGLILNEAGDYAAQCWRDIPVHFPIVVLHEFVIMPNHIHGIIEIIPGKYGRAENIQPVLSQEYYIAEYQKVIPGSIGSIVRGFKIGVTKWLRSNSDIKNVWHRNYYEHIIRSDKAYRVISNYIVQNPEKWERDKFYRENKLNR